MTHEEGIKAMKSQTFGCEVEMNSITRKDAATLIATTVFHRPDSVEYEGTCYQTWTCRDEQGRKWSFERDSSIAGPDSEKCEMVTPVLTYDDMEMLQRIIRVLRHAGAQSCPSRGCGVHIHVGEGNHTPKSICNLVKVVRCHEDQLIRAIGISERRLDSYCRKTDPRFLNRIKANKPDTWRKLAEDWYGGNPSYHTGHYDSSRYHLVNLHALFNRYHTIEFRMFNFDEPHDGKKGGLHAGQLKAMIQFCLAVSEFAKELHTCTDRPQRADDSDAFRSWMVRLHLVGDEFETCRNYLTRYMMPTHVYRSLRRNGLAA